MWKIKKVIIPRQAQILGLPAPIEQDNQNPISSELQRDRAICNVCIALRDVHTALRILLILYICIMCSAGASLFVGMVII